MLCYLDAERDELIARRLGVSRRTLARWKQRPEFAAAWAAVSAFHQVELDAARGYRIGGTVDLVPAGALRTVLPWLDRARRG